MGTRANAIPGLFELIDTSGDQYAELWESIVFPWDILLRLKDFFEGFQYRVDGTVMEGSFVDSQVSIGEGSIIEPGAVIVGPAIIGKNCRVRAGAYIRDHVIIGDNCVIGHSSEIKHSLLFTGSQVAHFNYVGDSILGHRSHMAAGAKIANVRITGGTVRMDSGEEVIDTKLVKFGAIIGDDAEIGCNAVLNPGSIIGKKSIIYPLVNWRGILPGGMIAKTEKDCIVRK